MLSNLAARYRTLRIVAIVVVLHALALSALQSGLLQRVAVPAQALVTPVSVITEPPTVATPGPSPLPPRVASPPKPAPRPVTPQPEPPVPPLTPLTTTAPQAAVAPLAVAAPPPDNAPQGVLQAAPAVAAIATVTPSAPAARLELPSSRAAYLSNPAPVYPALSRRLNEQGTVLLEVLVAADGRAKEVKIKTSSGFARLDRTARDAVLGWTFVPGKRAGVPEEMWFEVPMPFRLTD